ncbi:MAG: hypothetical protein IJ558_11700 [Treponema sp.]|nr:hypothetical protein [Treponema sp.]
MEHTETRAAIAYMKELHRQNAFFDQILETLVSFSESERKKHPEWRKGQALSVCTAIAFPHIEAELAKTDADCFSDDEKIPLYLAELKDCLFYGKSRVGIFWFYKDLPIFVHAVPLEQGEHYGEAITGTKDHADYWEELRSKIGWLSILPKQLQEEYFSIPRGRVVYHCDSERFFVYHGNNIGKQDLQKVAAVFCLPKDQTVFEEDVHYCDLSDEEWNNICEAL